MADGIPAYRGSRDYRPGDEDYAWEERHDDRDGRDGPREHGGGHQEGHGMGGHMMSGPGSGQGYGYGGAYGGYYGYGAYAYPIVIETVTTSGRRPIPKRWSRNMSRCAARITGRVRAASVPPRRVRRRGPRRARRPPPAGERG